jgi:hypothetical protein
MMEKAGSRGTRRTRKQGRKEITLAYCLLILDF